MVAVPPQASLTTSEPLRFADRVIVNTPGSAPASAAFGSPAVSETVGGTSSLTIVTVAASVPRVNPTGLERTTLNVSSGSTAMSPRIVTVIVAVVVPAGKPTIPLTLV